MYVCCVICVSYNYLRKNVISFYNLRFQLFLLNHSINIPDDVSTAEQLSSTINFIFSQVFVACICHKNFLIEHIFITHIVSSRVIQLQINMSKIYSRAKFIGVVIWNYPTSLTRNNVTITCKFVWILPYITTLLS